MVARGSVGSVTPAPYFSLLVNCALWVAYGALTADNVVLAPNALGLAAGITYAAAYTRVAGGARAARPWAVTAACVAGVVIACGALDRRAAARLLGGVGSAASLVVFASPLASLRRVLADRSTVSMPLPLTAAMFANAAAWAAYGGLVARDASIWAPNGLGVLVTGAQVRRRLI